MVLVYFSDRLTLNLLNFVLVITSVAANKLTSLCFNILAFAMSINNNSKDGGKINENEQDYRVITAMFPEYRDLIQYFMFCFNVILMIALFVFGMRVFLQHTAEDENADDSQDEGWDENFKLDDLTPSNEVAGPTTDNN